jgi:hypothetical protein
MPKVVTQDEFVKRCQLRHGDKYSYAESIYTNSHSKVIIICSEHGRFLQNPNNHFNGQGCPDCMGRVRNLLEFTKKANKIHNNKYDYTNVVYKGTDTTVNIVCKTHGEFYQTPHDHLSGCGCRACGGVKIPTNEEFIESAKKIHGAIYSYESTIYKRNKSKVLIRCNLHGLFLQSPSDHLNGKGCVKCGYLKVSQHNGENPPGWNYENWMNKGLKSKLFDGFKVYIIRCENNGEIFYKIGKTYRKISHRFRPSALPYKYNVIDTIQGDSRDMCILEHHIKIQNKNYKYSPKLNFGGMEECLSKLPEKTLKQYSDDLF